MELSNDKIFETLVGLSREATLAAAEAGKHAEALGKETSSALHNIGHQLQSLVHTTSNIDKQLLTISGRVTTVEDSLRPIASTYDWFKKTRNLVIAIPLIGGGVIYAIDALAKGLDRLHWFN